MKYLYTSIAVALGLTSILAPADDTIFGREQTTTRTDFLGELRGGLGLQLDALDGTSGLLVLGGKIGFSEKRVYYKDGTEKVARTKDIALLSGELRADLVNSDVRAIDVTVGDLNATGLDGFDALGMKGVMLRFNKGAAIETELRVYDVSFEWDLAGKTSEGRALRAGIGAGMYFFHGQGDRADTTWTHGTVIRGILSGIYRFNDDLAAQGLVEVFPLVEGGESVTYTGTVAEAEGSMEYRLAKHLAAFLKGRYQVVSAREQNSDEWLKVRQDLQLTGGLKLHWR